MKNVYPVVMTPDGDGYVVYMPDFDIYTQGNDLAEAMYMARDAIGLMGMDMEDDGLELPTPSAYDSVQHDKKDLVVLVDVDFTEYRRQHELRTVKKNCTIPSWLNEAASKAGLNFSKVLQDGLKQALGL